MVAVDTMHRTLGDRAPLRGMCSPAKCSRGREGNWLEAARPLLWARPLVDIAAVDATRRDASLRPVVASQASVPRRRHHTPPFSSREAARWQREAGPAGARQPSGAGSAGKVGADGAKQQRQVGVDAAKHWRQVAANAPPARSRWRRAPPGASVRANPCTSKMVGLGWLYPKFYPRKVWTTE